MRITIPIEGGSVNSHQQFTMQLGDNLLEFTLNFITLAGPAWSLDVSREGVLLIAGTMLEPDSNISKVYDADIGTLVFTGLDVTLDNLGIDNALTWISDDD